MPKVLAMEMISNAEVLNFLRSKKLDHDQQAAAAAQRHGPKPSNLLRALSQHQEHLESEHYPYMKNPSVYGNAGIIRVVPVVHDANTLETSDVLAERKFNLVFAERIILPAVKRRLTKEKERLGRALTSEEKDRVVAQADAERALSEAERLMVLNHAPACVEMLQPMIENIETRYSDEDQAAIVEAIRMAFRADEFAAAADTAAGEVNDAQLDDMEVDP